MLKKKELKTALGKSGRMKFTFTCICIQLICGIILSDEAVGATYYADVDTYVYQGSPSSSYGSSSIAYGGANGDNEYWALFRWDLSALQNVTIQPGAVARFYCSEYSGNLMTPEVYRVDSFWSEGSTWNSRPSYGGSDIGHDDLSSTGWFVVDSSTLVTIIQGWIDSSNNGLMIRHDAYGDLRRAGFRTENYGSLIAELSFTYTSCTAPPVPAGVSASDGTICGQVSITWSSSGADEYRVYRDGSPIGSWQPGTSYTDSPGDCSGHNYQVKARNTCGSYPESGLSSGNSGSAKCVPSAPTGVSATDGTVCDQVSITWGSVSGADTYRVYRDGSPIGSWQPSTSYIDNPGDTVPHSYQVRAQNSCGPGSLSSSDNGNAGSSPATPTGVSASDGTICDQVYITWNPSSGADEYRVHRDSSPVSSWQPGTTYYDSPGNTSTHSYQVEAQNSCGTSGLSSSDNGNTDTSPFAPTGLAASDGTYCDYVHVSWNPSSGADEYRVYWDGSPIGSWQAGTTYDNYIGDCNSHTYQIKAQNSCGESSLSSGDPGKTMCVPVITLDPVQDPDPVCDSNDVTFMVVATGDSLHYQWKVDDVNVGFDNPSYLWAGVNCSDDGAQVVCEVWNDCDIVTSNATTLYVDCGCLCCHHCDSDCDGRIIIGEVTLYGSYWKTGQAWPVEPNPIPIGYVTNCGYLWKVGECYDCNDLEVPPQCWQPAACGGGSMLMMGGGAAGPVSSSFNPLYYTPESPVEVTVEITPDPGTMVYAVEDAPPTGWTVDSINESGSWDDVNKKVKWGPYFDANIRTLTYNATPPAAETGEKTFSGTASFDGSDEPFDRPISDVCPLDSVGNFDDDCDVDWDDLAILIGNWLEGVQ